MIPEKVGSGFKVVQPGFFCRSVLDVAESLVYVYLFTRREGALCGGKIVECEAYLGSNDEASHAFCGLTDRNKHMFGPAGVAYVYLIYGVHLCFNVTAGKENEPGAVLIRSIKPEYGIEKMKERRGVSSLKKIASGPGNLTRAMGIKLSDNGRVLPSDDVFFCVKMQKRGPVTRTPRVGITRARELKYRFIAQKSEFVSGPRKINSF